MSSWRHESNKAADHHRYRPCAAADATGVAELGERAQVKRTQEQRSSSETTGAAAAETHIILDQCTRE